MLKSSHILYKVDNIKTAVAKLTDMGFDVQWGKAPEKAHNAHVWFDNGPFIEFFQLPTYAYYMFYPFVLLQGKAAKKRWIKWGKHPEGWCDIAIEPANEENVFDLSGYQKKLQEQHINCSKIIPGKRVKPNGELVKYNFMLLDPEHLPFLVSHYDPPQRPKSTIHPNGATGIKSLELKLPENQLKNFEILCGNDEFIQPISATETGIENVVFTGCNFKLGNGLQKIQNN